MRKLRPNWQSVRAAAGCLLALCATISAQTRQRIAAPVSWHSGTAVVRVNGLDDPALRLGLAAGGVTLVEFPTGDYVFARHPGDEDFVTLDAQLTARREPADPLIFRPGRNFNVSPGPRGQPCAQITVQMISGAVFTFHIYPVAELTRSATRVVLLYDPAAVIARRRSLGLPVNLHQRTFNATAPLAPDTTPPAAATPQTNTTTPDEPPVTEPAPTPATDAEDAELAQQAAQQALAQRPPNPKSWRFNAPVHGLTLAAQATRLVADGRWQLDLVAVKNTLSAPVRLVNLPELLLETRDGSTPLNRATLVPLASAHTLPENGLLAPGAVYYFALVTRPPVLGAKQHLLIAVAQTNAADEPATLELLVKAR